MSVGLFKCDGNIYDKNSKIIMSENIASQRIYDTYLDPAIKELNIKYFQDGMDLKFENRESVMYEIDKLLIWVKKNVNGEDREYLLIRLINIKEVINNNLVNEDDVLYIF